MADVLEVAVGGRRQRHPRRAHAGHAAKGNLHAKTGTLTVASSLSGYVKSADGAWLAFRYS